MKPNLSFAKSVVCGLCALLFFSCMAFAIRSDEETYSPKSNEESEILALILRSEVEANGWPKAEKICFSVNEMDPSESLVKALRQLKLNVRSSAEWRKKFNCGFEVHLKFVALDSLQNARVHSVVGDLRGINKGEEHFEVYIRDGEYRLRKIEGKWSVNEYVPSKKEAKGQ